jgi:dTDP-4-dehydrorhamnose reductase
MAKVLVTGSTGQLGQEMAFWVKELGLEEEFQFVGRDVFDLQSPEQMRSFLTTGHWRGIVNTGAWTAVDLAESNRDACFVVNAESPRILAEFASQHQIPMVQISTDFVFDGTWHRPLKSTDPCSPLGVYGQSKYAGEQAVLNSGAQALVIRTAWVYSEFGNNFVKTMRRLGAERSELGVVWDQIGSPTWARDLAKICVDIWSLQDFPKVETGILHYSNEGVCSWYDFAVAIMEESGLQCQVKPIPGSAYPTPAQRPHYSVLDKSEIKAVLGITIPHWRTSLRECIAHLSA